MKYVIVLSLLISSCTTEEGNRTRLIKEAEEFCKCHGGVSGFAYYEYSYALNCNDGTESKGNGNNRELHFYSSCPQVGK